MREELFKFDKYVFEGEYQCTKFIALNYDTGVEKRVAYSQKLTNEDIESFKGVFLIKSYNSKGYITDAVIFKDRGFVGYISDKTDEQGEEHSERWNQIKRYIKKNNVKNFIILDDEKISENEVSPNFIKTNSYKGLRKKHLNLIGNIWN